MGDSNESGFEGLGDAIASYVPPTPFADNTTIAFKVIDVEARSGVSQKNNKAWAGINITLEPEADDTNANPATIYAMLWKPGKGDDAKQANRAIGRIANFCASLGYTPEGDPKPEEMLGLTGRAVVRHIGGEDGSKPKNDIRYFLVD